MLNFQLKNKLFPELFVYEEFYLIYPKNLKMLLTGNCDFCRLANILKLPDHPKSYNYTLSNNYYTNDIQNNTILSITPENISIGWQVCGDKDCKYLADQTKKIFTISIQDLMKKYRKIKIKRSNNIIEYDWDFFTDAYYDNNKWIVCVYKDGMMKNIELSKFHILQE